MPKLPESPWARGGAAALLGVVAVFAFAPFDLFWLIPAPLLGLFLMLRKTGGERPAFALGLCFGLGFFLTGVSWVYVSLSVFGGMPPWLAGFATLLFCGVMALFPALLAAVFKRWQPARVLHQAFLFGALWTLSEWLRGWIFTGFPWIAIGYTQTPPSPLAGFAPLVGVYGVTWVVATLAALLTIWRVGVPALIVVLAIGFGLRQLQWTTPVGEPVTVALVQGNISQDVKWQREHFVRTLKLYRDLVVRHPAQLVILPETAVPAFLDDVPPAFLEDLRYLARRNKGDIVFGTATAEGQNFWNTAVSIGVSPTQMYRKVHLVPFGEFIPFGFSWFLKVVNIPMADFARGNQAQRPLAVAGQKIAANICYEDAFGEEIIQALPEATLLANMSNTAWFGRSLAQPQHLQISQMRALETGRPMLRATNTGMTAIITPDGIVQAALPAFTTGALVERVRGYQGLTPYARFGNWPALLLALGALSIGLKRQRRQDAAV